MSFVRSGTSSDAAEDQDAEFERANSYLRHGKLYEAIECYNRVIRMNPKFREAYINKGLALMHQKRREEAELCYSKAFSLDTDYARDCFEKGVSLAKQGDHEEAIKLYENVTAIMPADGAAYRMKGLSLNELGKFDAAHHCLDKAIRAAPTDKHVYASKAFVFDTQGKLDDAIAFYDKAICRDPWDPEPCFSKGTVLVKQHKFDLGLYAFEKAINLNPRFVQAYLYKGYVLQKQGKIERAMKCFDEAIAIEPSCAEAYYYKATNLQEQEKLDAAVECFDKALNLEPRWKDVFLAKGTVYEQHEKFDEALSSFDKALELDPSNIEALVSKARVLEKLGKIVTALECVDKVLSFSPEHPNAYWIKAKLLYAQGKSVEAEQCVKESVRDHGSASAAASKDDSVTTVGDHDPEATPAVKSISSQMTNGTVSSPETAGNSVGQHDSKVVGENILGKYSLVYPERSLKESHTLGTQESNSLPNRDYIASHASASSGRSSNQCTSMIDSSCSSNLGVMASSSRVDIELEVSSRCESPVGGARRGYEVKPTTPESADTMDAAEETHRRKRHRVNSWESPRDDRLSRNHAARVVNRLFRTVKLPDGVRNAKQMIKDGFEINSRDAAGNTVLHKLIKCEHPHYDDIVETLLDDDDILVDLDAQDGEGRTMLHLSLLHGTTSLADTLLGLGANPNILDDQRKTALFYVAEMGQDTYDYFLRLYRSLFDMSLEENQEARRMANAVRETGDNSMSRDSN